MNRSSTWGRIGFATTAFLLALALPFGLAVTTEAAAETPGSVQFTTDAPDSETAPAETPDAGGDAEEPEEPDVDGPAPETPDTSEPATPPAETPTPETAPAFGLIEQQKPTDAFKLGTDKAAAAKLFYLTSGGLTVDVPNAASDTGLALQGWTVNGNMAQAFWLVYNEATGYYTITNAASKKSLDLRDGGMEPGTVVQQWDSDPSSVHQQWRIQTLDDGNFQIVSATSGLPVGFAGNQPGSPLITTEAGKGATFKLSPYTPSIGEGTYTVRSAVGNSQVLEVADASWNSDQGGLIQSFADNGAFCQKWYFRTVRPGVVTIQNVGSGEYLADGGNGIVQSWAGGAAREWRVGYSLSGYTFMNVATGGILSLTNASGASGTKAQGSGSSDGSAQQAWSLTGTSLITGGTYEISPVGDANMRLDVEGASRKNANVQLWYANGDVAQRWTVHGAGNGWWTLTSGCAYKGLDVADGGNHDGANVQQWSTNRGTAQLWRPEMGPYGLQLISATGRTLDAAGGSTAAGTNVQVWSINGAMAQAWRLSTADSAGTTTHWLGIDTVGQPNNYYCGPTSGYMILSNVGAWSSASGTPLNVWNVAAYMDTDAYGYTSFNDRKFQQGMNNWLGTDQYYTVHTPSTEDLRNAILHSYDTGYATAVDEQERRGGPHMNGHSNSTFSHIMVVDGYDEATDAINIADPGISLWGGASDHFWYNLPAFRDNFLAWDLNDGLEHIGYYASR